MNMHTKQSTKQNYLQRLERVVNYIGEHLDQDLEVNQLAEIAHFSPYHFHRIYREMMGEPVNSTVRRYRLHHAAHALISTEQPIFTIAKSVCYGSVEAFSRAFTKAYGFTPAQYRTERKVHCLLGAESLQTTRQLEDLKMFTIEMMDFPETRLIGIEHVGDYMQIGHKFDQLFMQAGTLGLLNENTRSFGLYYGDPDSVPAEDLRSAACVSVNEADISKIKSDVYTEQTIPKGQYATLLFKGPYSEASQAYSWMFGEWLPNSGLQMGDFPPIEEYLNDPKETAPEELLTRIYCLIKAA